MQTKKALRSERFLFVTILVVRRVTRKVEQFYMVIRLLSRWEKRLMKLNVVGKQQAYNEEQGITPQALKRTISKILSGSWVTWLNPNNNDSSTKFRYLRLLNLLKVGAVLTPQQLDKEISIWSSDVSTCLNLEFELAAQKRDEIRTVKKAVHYQQLGVVRRDRNFRQKM